MVKFLFCNEINISSNNFLNIGSKICQEIFDTSFILQLHTLIKYQLNIVLTYIEHILNIFQIKNLLNTLFGGPPYTKYQLLFIRN